METTNNIITRFPPSPTGNLHIGNIRTLLFNYLFTRHNDGKIVMRFEDTDTERSKKEYEDVALQTLAELGLDFDEGPYRQSERTERYVEVLEKLIADDKAYVAEESEGTVGEHVIRFRNPNTKVTFADSVRGDITIDTTDFGDFIIARSLRKPLYHLSVIVDDIDMNVTHVIRGEDHITSTPRQILLIEAVGGTVPHYAHLPLIIGPDKKKLGKRHGATSFNEFKELGILPEALFNYLALLGWNPGDEREIFSKEELVKEFSLERVNNSPAMFSYDKLASINKHYLDQLDTHTYEVHIRETLETSGESALISHERFSDVVELVLRERLHMFSEVLEMLDSGELKWLLEVPTCEPLELTWKDSTKETTLLHLAFVHDAFVALEEWSLDTIKNAVWGYAEEHGKGDVLWPTRYALTGAKRSPDPFTVAYLLGKEDTLARLANAQTLLQ